MFANEYPKTGELSRDRLTAFEISCDLEELVDITREQVNRDEKVRNKFFYLGRH